jgi:hypothetical protein
MHVIRTISSWHNSQKSFLLVHACRRRPSHAGLPKMMATAKLRRTAHLLGDRALRKTDCGVLNPDVLVSGDVVDVVVGDGIELLDFGGAGCGAAGWGEIAATDEVGRLVS